ncbi:hypothetical protein, partial [Nocardia abscessus]|uniref:hypothetical protein n=1 Tax=Nocardia abscessus TaxID=120957 RepID=UPI0024549A6B
MTAPDLAHGENFSLEHYLDPAAHTFEQRFAEFRPYAQHARGSGFVLREVAGPSGAVVRRGADAPRRPPDQKNIRPNNNKRPPNKQHKLK